MQLDDQRKAHGGHAGTDNYAGEGQGLGDGVNKVAGRSQFTEGIDGGGTAGVITDWDYKEIHAIVADGKTDNSLHKIVLGDDGVKHVVEKGWFTRGVKLLVAGFKRDDTFVAKTYSNTGFHQLYKITDVFDNGEIKLTHERQDTNNE